MNKFVIIIFLPLLFCSLIINAGLTLDQAGTYIIGDDLVDTGTAIRISANRVYLDLGKKLITGGTDGIVIDPGVSNVTISNGLIASFANNGIVVGENCKSISIEKVGIGLCAESGIALKGTSTSNKVSKVTISEVVVSQCALQSYAQAAILYKYCDNALTINSRIVDSGSALGATSIIKIDQSTECIFLSDLVINNSGKSITMINMINSSNCVFRDCNFGNNSSSNGDAIGFLLTGTSTANIFGRCNIVNLVATGGNMIGFYFNDGQTKANDSSLCQIVECEGDSVFGFKVENSCETIFNECIAARNIAQGADGLIIGFDIINAKEGALRNCISAFNTVATGTATGIVLDSSSGFIVRDCSMSSNVGTTDSDSFGLTTTMGTKNGFIKNFAFDNGALPTNQFVGVPSGSVTQINYSNLNSVTAPFTNIAVNS